jgi:hypothetical protein
MDHANTDHKVAEAVRLLWKAHLILADGAPPCCRSAEGADSAELEQAQEDSQLEQEGELRMEEACKASS